MKKLEAASVEQQQQQAQAQAQASSTALTEAQLAAAAYYQAQFMLMANSAASTPTASDGTGTTVDSSALSEYYRQVLGYVWNDRTPTSSDVEDAGTPLPSDKEDEKKEGCPRAGEIQASSDPPSELKSKDKGTNKGERERRKVKRSRKHKRVSTEDPSSTMATEKDVCGATQNGGDSCDKPLSGQENAVVGTNPKSCDAPGDNQTNGHQSDTNPNACTRSTTNGAGIVSEVRGCHSPPREKPSPRRYRETKELHRKEQEPHREMNETQRLHSNSRSPANSPIQKNMNNQHQFEDKSASSHDMKAYHSADPKEVHVNCSSCSPKGEKQSPRRERRDREKNELQRGMKEHHRASVDIQRSIDDSHRLNHIKRLQSSSRSPHSPTSENVSGQYQSSILALNADPKAHTRGNRIIPSHHTPRVEKRSPKRHREERETSKSYREMNREEEARQLPRETICRRAHRETREECIELREGHREMKDTHRVVVEPHRETNGFIGEVHKEMKEPHRELKNQHRVMMEPPRVTKEAHGDMREAHRGVRGTQRETRVAYRETREPQRGMREADRETMEASRDPRTCRNFQEPQSDTMELRRDRRMTQRETREEYGDRECSHDRRSHSSSRLSSSSRHRSRSPSYDKENIRRPPSLGREGRPRRESMDTRSGQANSLERSNEDLSSRRRLIRKRKLSSSSQSASKHSQKQARRESYHQDSSERTNKDRHSQHSRPLPIHVHVHSHRPSPKLHSSRLASPVCYSSDFDDITNPPTPSADDILPYCADVQLCENSAVLPCDNSGANRNKSDAISCPPTPTNELQRQDKDKQTTSKDTERESSAKDSENKPQENLNLKQANDKIVELNDQKKPESCLDGGDNPLHVAVASDTTILSGGESKMEDVVNEEKEASDLEEGEITDSDSDSGGETEPAMTKETRGDDGPGTCVERRKVNISGNCQSQEVEKGGYCEQLVDERRPRRSSCHGSAGHHHHRERRSPRASRHTPLSERRNRRSPPSVKKSVYDQDGRMHSHSERHAKCHHSSRHLRSNCNLPEHIY